MDSSIAAMDASFWSMSVAAGISQLRRHRTYESEGAREDAGRMKRGRPARLVSVFRLVTADIASRDVRCRLPCPGAPAVLLAVAAARVTWGVTLGGCGGGFSNCLVWRSRRSVVFALRSLSAARAHLGRD